MTKGLCRLLAGGSFLVFVSLGVVPLIQWFVFDHRSGLIGRLFGEPQGAWAWGAPMAVLVLAFASMWFFGNRAEGQAQRG